MSDPVRLTVQLGSPESRRLIHARADDAVPASQRVRAVLHLWRNDAQVRTRIDELAKERRRAGRVSSGPGQQESCAKITVLVEAGLNTALWEAKSVDGISIAKRVGAGLHLWCTDVEFTRQVDAVAAELHAAQRAKKAAA